MASKVGTKIFMAHSAQFLKDYFGGEFTPAKMLTPISTAWKMTGATDVIDVGVSVPTYVIASYQGCTPGIGPEKHFTFVMDRSGLSHYAATYKLETIKGVMVRYKTA